MYYTIVSYICIILLYDTTVLYNCFVQAIKEWTMNGSEIQNAPYLTKEAQETQRRLLDAGEELFAQKGFDGTSIRDITTKAERSPGAINYFFGNKQVLYEELFRRRMSEMREIRLLAIDEVMSDETSATLEKLLVAFAKAFLQPFTDNQASHRFMQLFTREMSEQRLPKGMFMEELAGPTLGSMGKALGTLCPKLDETSRQSCIISIIAQLVQIIHIKGMFEGGENLQLAIMDIPKAIEHIVKFSAAGIRTCEA